MLTLSQGVDPSTYPYAYLITAPCFLGYHFNTVSFWYLYDTEKCLVAMILEANNTFDERRMYFLTQHEGSAAETEHVKSSRHRGAPKAVFKQSWPKDFHVSPFNSRRGSYTLSASDPLGPCMQSIGPINNTIVLASSEGHVKLVTDLCSSGPAIDPCAMTALDKFRFLLSWWWVGFLTLPRIYKQAFSLFFRSHLHVWYKPEPLKESMGRRANSTERRLEPIFRRYLQYLVEQSASPLAVRYVASGVSQDSSQQMLSRAARETGAVAEELELKVLTPVFYTRFVYYSQVLEAFLDELNEGRTIWVSRPDLLHKLALKQAVHSSDSFTVYEHTYFSIIQRLRVRPGRSVGRDIGHSAMDAYVLAHESADGKATYRNCVMKLFLADRITLGSVPLLETQRLFLQLWLTWLLSSAMANMIREMFICWQAC